MTKKDCLPGLLKIYRETILDGEGIRYSIYLSGCHHRCPGCHNPESWDPKAGERLTDSRMDKIIQDIKVNSFLDGVTISGGDPFYNPQSLVTLLRRIKSETNQNIWCYTGYTIEQLLADRTLTAPLQYIDVLIDGRYEEKLKTYDMPFRGSINQRIIHIRKYLQQNGYDPEVLFAGS